MRILACIPLAYDATSYYRSMGVFPNLRKHLDFEIRIDSYGGRGWTWAELSQYDVLFMQRPSHPDWLKLAEYCKNIGLKIWVDHDDNLFELPPYNRVFDTYTPKVKECMLSIMKLADVVTVSTKALKEYCKGLGVESIVIPNALNDQITKPVTKYNEVKEVPPPQKRVERFVWRGSETHLADLYFFAEELAPAMIERPATHWSFLGYNPWFITMYISQEKWKYFIPDDIMVYYNNLRSIAPQVMHVPLYRDHLNHCKSNIAWIEATAAGAVTIAPDWEEWQKPGVINYKSMEHYKELLMAPLDNCAEKWQQSMDYINENLLLTKVNKVRADILRKFNSNTQRIEVTNKDSKIKPEYILSNLPETMIE